MAIAGIGDASLGQWEEDGIVAYHIRRRLSLEEQAMIGDAVDIRGTEEAAKRLRAVARWLPQGWDEKP